ncbi:MAG TPA: hypothetical protein VFL30_03600 [Rhodanobacteraceae bacterium]|nr:hypothetical protein [Rhodanobacteraceae bacterium]
MLANLLQDVRYALHGFGRPAVRDRRRRAARVRRHDAGANSSVFAPLTLEWYQFAGSSTPIIEDRAFSYLCIFGRSTLRAE